jgi:hypothetical protein
VHGPRFAPFRVQLELNCGGLRSNVYTIQGEGAGARATAKSRSRFPSGMTTKEQKQKQIPFGNDKRSAGYGCLDFELR